MRCPLPPPTPRTPSLPHRPIHTAGTITLPITPPAGPRDPALLTKRDSAGPFPLNLSAPAPREWRGCPQNWRGGKRKKRKRERKKEKELGPALRLSAPRKRREEKTTRVVELNARLMFRIEVFTAGHPAGTTCGRELTQEDPDKGPVQRLKAPQMENYSPCFILATSSH